MYNILTHIQHPWGYASICHLPLLFTPLCPAHSPADSEADKASDNFFSQKTILPSPWTAPMTSNKVTTSAFPFKRVTFSPLPPATACKCKGSSPPFPPFLLFLYHQPLLQPLLHINSLSSGTLPIPSTSPLFIYLQLSPSFVVLIRFMVNNCLKEYTCNLCLTVLHCLMCTNYM